MAGVTPTHSEKSKGTVYMNNTSKITVLKTVRIKNETAEFFKEKPLNRYIEDLHRSIERDDIREKDGHLDVVEVKCLRDACKPRGANPGKLIKQLADRMVELAAKEDEENKAKYRREHPEEFGEKPHG